MSDEQQNLTDEDVEAHRRRAAGEEPQAPGEADDDVEAHRRRAANDEEESSDDDGDVEGHVFKM